MRRPINSSKWAGSSFVLILDVTVFVRGKNVLVPSHETIGALEKVAGVLVAFPSKDLFITVVPFRQLPWGPRTCNAAKGQFGNAALV